MERSIVRNFTNTDELSVSGVQTANSANLVFIYQNLGTLSFCFHMTPAQARELADALISHADDVEKN